MKASVITVFRRDQGDLVYCSLDDFLSMQGVNEAIADACWNLESLQQAMLDIQNGRYRKQTIDSAADRKGSADICKV